jgi:hypothetical protein
MRRRGCPPSIQSLEQYDDNSFARMLDCGDDVRDMRRSDAVDVGRRYLNERKSVHMAGLTLDVLCGELLNALDGCCRGVERGEEKVFNGDAQDC